MADISLPALPPIEIMILKGCEQRLSELFSVTPDQVIFVASTNRMQIAKRVTEMRQGTGAALRWPLLFLHVNTVSLGTTEQLHASNTRSQTRHGIYTQLADSNETVTRVTLVPVIFEIEIIYMVDDFLKAFAYTNAWMAHATANRMNFTVTYGKVGIDIRVVMSDTASTPDREEGVDQPNQFEYTSTIRVAGYSTDQDPGARAEVPILRKPVTTVSLGTDLAPTDPLVYDSQQRAKVLDI